MKPKDMEKLAASLIKVYRLVHPGPNMIDLVHRMGGKLDRDESLKIHSPGFIYKSHKHFNMHISANLSTINQNMMLGKLMGHLLVNMGYDRDTLRWNLAPEYPNAMYDEEVNFKNALYLATALFMPRSMYYEIFTKYDIHEDKVDAEKIADYFQVSIDWVIIRGVNIGHIEEPVWFKKIK